MTPPTTQELQALVAEHSNLWAQFDAAPTDSLEESDLDRQLSEKEQEIGRAAIAYFDAQPARDKALVETAVERFKDAFTEESTRGKEPQDLICYEDMCDLVWDAPAPSVEFVLAKVESQTS